ncbi:hypothetical protein WN48_02216 [Eufriesea mexicana]|uniref:Uncharacterized protein n=1 Tax=Eufriesea mexicana TaxID=516756 RepID=A0A310SBH9_9HYME|nr:hypothetical protein WN48_02216 [Eufriesea mexicana]
MAISKMQHFPATKIPSISGYSQLPVGGKRAYRDFNLLSFGGEAKEDEEESVILNKKFTGKGKSAHGHLSDSKLCS